MLEIISIALAMISDNQTYFETKANYGKDMVTAFIKLNGTTVGAVANRTEICDENGEVAESFWWKDVFTRSKKGSRICFFL